MLFKNYWILHFLWLLILPAFIYCWDERRRRKLLSLFGSFLSIANLTESVSLRKRYFQKGLEFIILFLIIITLARPLFEKGPQEVQRKGVEIVIAVDVSLSMLAEDYHPNRLTKAKQELEDLLNKLKGNRIGLVAFAGVSLTLCPLTLDTNALKIYLDILDTQLIGIQGTALSDAIRSALSLFENKTSTEKLIVLLTDGEDQGGKALESAKEAHKKGIRIYTIGIGSREGEPIPLTDESGNRIGHKKDDQGNIVLTRLDENILQEISRVSEGKYFRVTSGLMEIEKIFNDIQKLQKGELGKSLLFQYEEGFQIPLLMVLIGLICIEFLGDRKGLLLRHRQKLFKGGNE